MHHASTDGESKDSIPRQESYCELYPLYWKMETINALLHAASTKIYINADVAAEFWFQGQVQKVIANVLKHNVESSETILIEVELQSLNGQSYIKITAFITNVSLEICSKILRVLWQTDNNIFTFKANPPVVYFKFTKRNFLGKIALIFDPLGFIAPFTIKAKVL